MNFEQLLLLYNYCKCALNLIKEICVKEISPIVTQLHLGQFITV